MRRALVVQGGWQGHQPRETAEILVEQLAENGFDVELSDTLDSFRTADLEALHLIVPHWTQGTLEQDQLQPLVSAVKNGVGLAGMHGGVGDAFRDVEFHRMVGGEFLDHPDGGGVTYAVHIEDISNPITEGMKDFEVTSEQYYMLVDPGNLVLATTRFGDVVMPVAWIRHYGKGHVFYTSLGHSTDIVRKPEVLTMITRGMLWAAKG